MKARVKRTGLPPAADELARMYAALTDEGKRRIAYLVAEQVIAGHTENVIPFPPQSAK